MLVDPRSVLTGFRLLPLAMSGLSLTMLAELPGLLQKIVDPPDVPATIVQRDRPLVSLACLLLVLGGFQLIPWFTWRKYHRLCAARRPMDEASHDAWRDPFRSSAADGGDQAAANVRMLDQPSVDSSADGEDGPTIPPPGDCLFDGRLSLQTERWLAVVAYVLPPLLLGLALPMMR